MIKLYLPRTGQIVTPGADEIARLPNTIYVEKQATWIGARKGDLEQWLILQDKEQP